MNRLERLLDFWAAMLEIESTIQNYNVFARDVVFYVGTNAMGERSYEIDMTELQDQRRTLAEAIATVLADERRMREVERIGLPVKDDELATAFQQLWTAAGNDSALVAAADRDQRANYDSDKWRAFQQLLFKRGIVV